jgi:hypothetical protein
VLIALLLVIFIVRSRSSDPQKKRIPNYRALFILGITWIPIGIGTENPGLWALGLVFMTIGLVNKAKWGQETKWADLSPQIKRTKIILFSVLTIMLLALVIVYFLKNGE